MGVDSPYKRYLTLCPGLHLANGLIGFLNISMQMIKGFYDVPEYLNI